MKRIARGLGLVLLCAWSVAPFLWALMTSVKPTSQLEQLPPLLPASVTFAHYGAVFTGYPLAHMLLNSLVVALCTAFVAVALGSLAGFAVAMLRPRGAAWLIAGTVMLSMMPPIATVTPLFLMINGLGLRDTLAGLILVYSGFAMPLALWLMTQFFRALPYELYVAARVDGCSALGAFRKVLFPLTLPGAGATALLVFIFAWNEFLFALTLTSSNAARTVPVGIALFPGLHEIPWGEIAAGSVVTTLPVLALAVLFQRRLVDGLTVGAVKG